jgi:hypothetical protein
MNYQTCLMAHTRDPERPRPARHGVLCIGHFNGLVELLCEIPALAGEVEPSLIRSSLGAGPKVSGSRTEPLPYDDIVSKALRDCRDVLASWAADVIDQHPDRLHPPRFGTLPTAAFLIRHLDWISEQEWVTDLYGEVRDRRQALRWAIDTRPTRRVDLGPCDLKTTCNVETHEEVTCKGIMRAVVHASDEDLPASISCTACGSTRQPSEWRALARFWRKGLEPMLTAAQISHLFHVPIGTVHFWAHRDEWRRDDKRPRSYHSDDAQASYERGQADKHEAAS